MARCSLTSRPYGLGRIFPTARAACPLSPPETLAPLPFISFSKPTEEAGFARLRCDTCGVEKLLTLSCRQRGICPSCDAKRAAAFAALLKDELLENVGHCLWTFTIPKMLYFMYQRELLGNLVRLGYETINELMSEAAGDHKARPGVIAVPQTFGGVLNVHPHAHCLAGVESCVRGPGEECSRQRR